MGDGIDYRLDGISVLPGPAPAEGPIPWGIRLTPGLQLNVGGFFTEFRLEGGAGQGTTTPIGANYFDSVPSSSLSDKVPVSAWVYAPKSDEDLFRANFGIRSLNVGYRFTPDFFIRFGRYRYDVTEHQRLLMANAYSGQSKFSYITIPLHWLGGEIRYDRRRGDETVRQLLFSASSMYGADNTVLGVGQGLVSFALNQDPHPPLLTLTAYGSVRSNPQPTSGAPYPTPGLTHGEGFALQLDYGIFSGIAGYAHRDGFSVDDLGREIVETRDGLDIILDLHPGDFRFRGALAFLNRGQGKDVGLTPATGQTEIDTEISASYSIVEGLQVSAGYRGAYSSDGRSSHMAFLGLLSTFHGTIPFH